MARTDHVNPDQELRARLATELQQLIQQQGLSIRALAKRAGLARNTVLQALKGGHSHPFTRKRLLHVLHEKDVIASSPIVQPRLTLEDMEIAMAYHDASTPVRNFIAKIFGTREYRPIDLRPETVVLAHQIDQMTDRDREFIRIFVTFALEAPPAPSEQESTG